MLMLRMIMSGDYKFGSPEWDDQSDTVKDLVGCPESLDAQIWRVKGGALELGWSLSD